MTKPQILLTTRLLLIATPVIWIAWDIFAELVGGNAYTESANIFYFSLKYPSIPLSWGYLTGHFFAQVRKPSVLAQKTPKATGYIEIGALAVALLWLCLDLSFYPTWVTRVFNAMPGPGNGSIEAVLLGTIVGFFVFQMHGETEVE